MKKVLGDNLLRLRKKFGLTQKQLANASCISISAYRSLEKGQSDPRAATLRALAEALNVHIKELLQPVQRLERVRFRSLKKLKRRNNVLAEVARRLADFSDLEDITGETISHKLLPLWNEFATIGRSDILQLASRVRSHFGLNEKEPVHDICGLLESQGVKVFSIKVASDAFMGLSVAEEEGGPAVVVNTWSRLPVETWIFSAAHELGHLLLHLNAFEITEEQEDKEQEHEADVFSSCFLMPEAAFAKEWRDAEGLPLVDRVLKVKRVFRVSWRTVLYRVADRLPEEQRPLLWQHFNRLYRQRKGTSLLKHDEPDGISREIYQSALGQRPVGVEPARMDSHDFQGDRLWRLVRHAIEQEAITLSRAAEILQLPLLEMRELSASWIR